MKFIILLLFSINAIAIIPHKLQYKLSVKGFTLGTEYRELTLKDNVYHYNAHAKTEGIASLIRKYKIKASSEFIIDDGLKSKKFNLLEIDKGKVKKDLDIIIDNRTVKYGSRVWQIYGNVIDQLNIFLAIAYDLKHNRKLSYQIANGKEIKKRSFTIVAQEQMEVLGKKMKVIKVSDNDEINAYFAPKLQYIPVLIKKDNWQYKLKKYE